MEVVAPSELPEIVDSGDVTVLDLRREDEFEENHISGKSIETVNVYFHSLKDKGRRAILDKIDTEKVVVVCWTGKCSVAIARMLESEGFDAMSLEGGMQNWS
ncbi:MAG: rhodanese-like domain-containing protein [Candidatus Aenigmatarchaeota archaeon]